MFVNSFKQSRVVSDGGSAGLWIAGMGGDAPAICTCDLEGSVGDPVSCELGIPTADSWDVNAVSVSKSRVSFKK